jgi:hypothetical protein
MSMDSHNKHRNYTQKSSSFYIAGEQIEAEQGRAEENKSKQSRGRSRGELTSRVIGEEEG